MKRYTVGQMAKAMGVSPQTLRHYEEMGLVEAQRMNRISIVNFLCVIIKY